MDNSPLEIFYEDMKSDELATRINTVHKLPIVATLIPTNTIKTQLLPYLEALIKNEDDEIVFAIAEELASIAPLLNEQHIAVLPLLETLCAHDETVVRERAVQSIIRLSEGYQDSEFQIHLIPLVMRLATVEAHFTCRVSATLLMCDLYARAGPNKERIRQKFMEISNEQMLILQRVTATKISQMCQVYDKEHVLTDLLSILKQRSTDEQDQIRVLAVESFKEVAKKLSRDENKTYIMPMIIQVAEDKSWRVKLCLSKNFPEIARGFGSEVTDVSLIQIYANLLKDTQNDVKVEAVKSLIDFIEMVEVSKVHVLLASVIQLGKDSLSEVRAHVGGVICNMIRTISKEQAYQVVQPLIKQLMADKHQEVRRSAVQAATKFVEVLGPQAMAGLNTNFKECLEDQKWRVRLELFESITDLTIKLKDIGFFNKHISDIFRQFLRDTASSVRTRVLKRIGPLCKCLGQPFVGPLSQKMQAVLTTNESYRFKIGALLVMKEIIVSGAAGTQFDFNLQTIIKGLHERIPNLRLVSINCLIEIAQELPQIKDNCRKQISALVEDEDVDVRSLVQEVLA